jgi:hypothetical protein
MSLHTEYSVPEYWTNDVESLEKLFSCYTHNTTNYFKDETGNFILFHKPFDKTSELLKLSPLGENDLIIESWIKDSGENIESDILSLMCMFFENSVSYNRADILNPATALKPSHYSWNKSGALNTQVSIMSYALWLSRWFSYKDFFGRHGEVEFPFSLSENYGSELNFIIHSNYLVSLIFEGFKYNAFFWETGGCDIYSINHKNGVLGYLENKKLKLRKQYKNISPTLYGLKSPSDMLEIVYTQDILPHL